MSQTHPVSKPTHKDSHPDVKHLASFPEKNPNPVLEIALDGQLVYSNPAARSLFPDLENAGLSHPYLQSLSVLLKMPQHEADTAFFRVVQVGSRFYQQAISYVEEYRTLRVYGLDITERLRAQSIASQNQALINAILQGSPDTLFLKDRQSRMLLANPATLAAIGRTMDEVVGKTDLEYLDDKTAAQAIIENDRQVMESGQTQAFEETYLSEAGERTFLTTKTPYHDEDGKVIGVIGVAHDITDRKKAEKEVERVNRTLRALSNINQAMLRALDEAGLLADACRIVIEDCGYLSIWIGFTNGGKRTHGLPAAQAGFEPGQLEALESAWGSPRFRPAEQAIRSGQPSIHRRLLNESRSSLKKEEFQNCGAASAIGLPLMDGGNPIGAVTIYSCEPDPFSTDEVRLLTEMAHDLAFGITTLRLRLSNERSQADLVKSEAKYRRLLENMNDLVCEVDDQARYVFVNDRYPALLGYSPAELLGRPVRELIHPDDLKNSTPRFSQLIGGASVARNIWRFKHKNGEWRWFDCSAQSFEKSSGVMHAVVIARDITEQRQMEVGLQASEARYHSLFSEMTEGFALCEIIADASGNPIDYRFLEINPAFERLTGLSRADVMGRTLWQVLPGDDPLWVQTFGRVALTGEPAHFENYSIVLKQYYEVYAYRTAPGQFGIMFMNITQRRNMEDAVQASSQKLQEQARMLDLAHILVRDMDDHIIFWNSGAEQLYGWTAGEALGKVSHDLLHTIFSKSLRATVQSLQKTGTWEGELSHARRDGTRVQVASHQVVHRDAEGNPLAVIEVNNDITALKQAEGALRQAEQNLAEANARLEQRVKLRTEQYETVNRELTAEIAERKGAEKTIRENAARTNALAELARSLAAAPPDLQTVLEVTARAAAQALGDVCFIHLASDDRKRLELAAIYHADAAEKRRLNDLLSSLELDLHLPLIDALMNDQKSLLLSPFDSHVLAGLLDPTLLPSIQQVPLSHLVAAPLSQEADSIGILAVARMGAGVPYTPDDLQFLKIIADLAVMFITKARLYQDLQAALVREQQTHLQLIQAEKNTALARMVASIAHEINNPIQTINNCMFLLKGDLQEDSEASEILKMASSEATRIGDLVARLRELYKPSKESAPKSFNVLDTVEAVHSLLLPHLQHHNVSWSVEVLTDRLAVFGIPDQLKQVFLNISLNAIDAMGGEDRSLQVHIHDAGDGQVCIAFKDSGSGIPPEDLPHIFEPFYTTKEKGSGLGLSICYEIVHNFGGEISVESRPGEGTQFNILLPLS